VQMSPVHADTEKEGTVGQWEGLGVMKEGAEGHIFVSGWVACSWGIKTENLFDEFCYSQTNEPCYSQTKCVACLWLVRSVSCLSLVSTPQPISTFLYVLLLVSCLML
jgi:hypothetical protein